MQNKIIAALIERAKLTPVRELIIREALDLGVKVAKDGSHLSKSSDGDKNIREWEKFLEDFGYERKKVGNDFEYFKGESKVLINYSQPGGRTKIISIE